MRPLPQCSKLDPFTIMMRKLIQAIFVLAGLLLATESRAQVPVFGSPIAIFTNTTSSVMGSNVVAYPVRPITMSLSVTNTNSWFQGYTLMSLDGTHFVTNGTFTTTPFTNGVTTNVLYTVSAYYTNVPIYIYLQGVAYPGGLNTIWATATYGP